MKKIVSILGILLVVLFFIGCSNRDIKIVKDGVLNFDKTITVGEAFDNYKYCKDVKWDSGVTENGRHFVEVICNYDIYNKDNSKFFRNLFKQKGIVRTDIIYQFDINKDGKTFELRGEFIKSYYKNGKTYSNNESNLNDALMDLKKIYEEKPLL